MKARACFQEGHRAVVTECRPSLDFGRPRRKVRVLLVIVLMNHQNDLVVDGRTWEYKADFKRKAAIGLKFILSTCIFVQYKEGQFLWLCN
jgi:hypothetical protein